MITTSPLIIQDPMFVLEVFALMLTICLLGKLVFDSSPSLQTQARHPIATRFVSLFEVGNLVPMPKESLKRQRVLRQNGFVA